MSTRLFIVERDQGGLFTLPDGQNRRRSSATRPAGCHYFIKGGVVT